MKIETQMYWFNPDRILPIRFYPYTTLVTNTIFWLSDINYPQIPKEVADIFEKVKQKAIATGKIQWDNKVVLECFVEGFPHPIFMGYKDHALVLGFSVSHEKYVKPIDL